jgi:hypothetical protein
VCAIALLVRHLASLAPALFYTRKRVGRSFDHVDVAVEGVSLLELKRMEQGSA